MLGPGIGTHSTSKLECHGIQKKKIMGQVEWSLWDKQRAGLNISPVSLVPAERLTNRTSKCLIVVKGERGVGQTFSRHKWNWWRMSAGVNVTAQASSRTDCCANFLWEWESLVKSVWSGREWVGLVKPSAGGVSIGQEDSGRIVWEPGVGGTGQTVCNVRAIRISCKYLWEWAGLVFLPSEICKTG